MHAQIMEQPRQLEIWLRLNPPPPAKSTLLQLQTGLWIANSKMPPKGQKSGKGRNADLNVKEEVCMTQSLV